MSKKKASASKRNPISPLFLEHVKLTSFGQFSNTIVGPFGPGMNVVYGSNEAGKTTVNELIKGVLFGWPSSRGQSNPYRPEQAERVGSLFFRNMETGEVVEVKRAKNSEGLLAPEGFLSDIDRETYRSIFALTSDELLGLDRHNEVTAHLLTAGSGTGSSPAHALEEVNERIRWEFSRSAKNPDSVPNLRGTCARLREAVHQGREEADALRGQESTLASFAQQREALSEAQQQLNSEIEALKTLETQLRELDSSIVETRTALHGALERSDETPLQEAPIPPELAELAPLTREEESQLEDELAGFEHRRAKLEQAVDAARLDAVRSKADFDVFSERAKAAGAKGSFEFQRRAKFSAAIAIAAIMVLAGAFVLYQAPSSGGLSYLGIGLALIVFAVVIAAAGATAAFRSAPEEDTLDEELKKRNWVMQQDEKTLQACEQALNDFDSQVASFMSENGLEAAAGSLHHARRLMAQLRDYRATCATAAQSQQARAVQCAALRKELAESRNQRVELCRKAGFPDNATAAEVHESVAAKERQRHKVASSVAEVERQYGEISERLAAARSSVDFDAAKFKLEEAEARLKETYRRLSVLFVAKRSLEAAIAEWERKSQPQVYREASRLLNMMTNGAWQQVRMDESGNLEVLDAVKTARAPHLLSLGTRQQLYLSLRIALLLSATNVGQALPVLCDDILVNFDDERRKGAARALAELACRRQVILFTCHSDVASLMRSVDPRSNSVEL